MRYHVNRRGRSMAIVACTLFAAACSSGGATSTTTAAAANAAQLMAEESGVVVNEAEVPKGQNRQVALDEQVVLGAGARGLLRVGDVELELLQTTSIRLVDAQRLEVKALLDKGQLNVRLLGGADQRLTLTTASAVTLTTLAPGTEFTACQGADPPRPTCLHVTHGAVEWQAKGTSTTYHAGEGTFAVEGDQPGPARCVPDETFDAWFQKARRNQDVPDLGSVVGANPLCTDATPTTSTAVTDATPGTSGGPPPASPSEFVTVPGTEAWTNTGLDVRPGDVVEIEARGAITHAEGSPLVGPDGDPGANLRVFNVVGLEAVNHAALIGRIGESGTPFLVGRAYRLTAHDDGRLFLGINDAGPDNNSGEFAATVTVSSS